MSVSVYFINILAVWIRRIWRLLLVYIRKFSKRYKLKHPSYRSVCPSVLAIFGIVLLAAFITVVVLFQLRNDFIVNFKFKIGWWKTAVVSISVLDSLEDVNFLNDESRHGEDDSSAIVSYLEHEHGNTVIWKVDGFSKYSEIVPKQAHTNNNHSPEDRNRTGFWVFSFEPDAEGSSTNTESQSAISAIRVFKITEHLASISGIPEQDLEVAVAIRVLVDGEATIVIRYGDSLSKQTHVEKLSEDMFKEKGFCNLILDVPFHKRVNMMYIRPTSTNLRKRGLVIVDQVFIVVSRRNVTESILHTLVPSNWCKAVQSQIPVHKNVSSYIGIIG